MLSLPEKLNVFILASIAKVIPNLLCPIKAHQTRRMFSKMNTRKAAGPDGITPRLMKHCSSQLSGIFRYIFNLSFSVQYSSSFQRIHCHSNSKEKSCQGAERLPPCGSHICCDEVIREAGFNLSEICSPALIGSSPIRISREPINRRCRVARISQCCHSPG